MTPLDGTRLERTEPEMPDRNHRSRNWATGSGMWLFVIAALAFVSAPIAWWTTDILQADNDFCNSCHLPDGTPLHTEIRDDFDGRPPASLAARHADLMLTSRPDSPSIRCIDCHGGVGLVGRVRVKLLSVKDSLQYLTGRFEEPEGMSWPLWDTDCRQCHQSFREKGEGFDGEAFHDKQLHNIGLGVDCVECHTAHDAEGDPELWFLRAASVQLRCAQCHVEYARNGAIMSHPKRKLSEHY